MANSDKAIASKRDQYLRVLQKAQQLDDPELVTFILKRIANLSRAEGKLTADRCLVIPLSKIRIPGKTHHHNRPNYRIPASTIKIGSIKMNKKLLTFFCIATALFIVGAFFFERNFNPVGAQFNAYEKIVQKSNFDDLIQVYHSDAPDKTKILGACALLLVGYLFWLSYILL